MPVPFFIAIIIVVAIFRMPANEVAPFTLKALDKFTRDWLNLILIFLWLLTMVVCYYRNKIMQDELDRMAAVRDEAQRQSGSNIESSEA